MHYDKFGNGWPDGPGYENEYCPECGQPDNCGDCTHGPLDREDVRELGGTPPPLAAPTTVPYYEPDDRGFDYNDREREEH